MDFNEASTVTENPTGNTPLVVMGDVFSIDKTPSTGGLTRYRKVKLYNPTITSKSTHTHIGRVYIA